MDSVAVKEALGGMLRCPGLSHELPKWKTSRPADHPSIGGASFAGLARLILDRPATFENTYVFSFLRSSLNLFPDKGKRCHCLNGPPEKQAAGIFVGAFAIWCEGFLFRVKCTTPSIARRGEKGRGYREKASQFPSSALPVLTVLRPRVRLSSAMLEYPA